MLTLTENATSVVKAIATQTVGTEDAGLRISSSPDSADGSAQAFAVSAVSRPEQGDEIVDSDGAKVFLTEDASAVLADKVLDAQVDSAGGVQFAIGTIAESPGAAEAGGQRPQ